MTSVAGRDLTFPRGSGTRFVLLGSGRSLCELARILVARGFPKPLIVTHPRAEHARDETLFSDGRVADVYDSVFLMAERAGMALLETSDANAPEVAAWLDASDADAAISVGCRSVLHRAFLDRFDGRVLNLHSSPLPEYRGGGGFSWQILDGRTSVEVVLHVVDERVDTGDIVLRRAVDLGAARLYPVDHMRVALKLSDLIFDDLLEGVADRRPMARAPQDPLAGTTFPRLLTEVNGVIDWTWRPSAVDRFVRAFGWPYPGASTWCGRRRLHVARCDPIGTGSEHHPFMSGLILGGGPDGSVRVVSGGEQMLIRSLRDGPDEVPAASVLRPGTRLHAPATARRDALARRVRF